MFDVQDIHEIISVADSDDLAPYGSPPPLDDPIPQGHIPAGLHRFLGDQLVLTAQLMHRKLDHSLCLVNLGNIGEARFTSVLTTINADLVRPPCVFVIPS